VKDGARYRFGPRERGGALAGWRGGQILTVALGLVIGVLALRAAPNAFGVALAVVILVLCAALALWPVAGRTGEQWLPVVVHWGLRHQGPPARRGLDTLGGLRILGVGRQDLGVVHDRRARTLTAALDLRGLSFALLAPDEQDRRVGAWSSVLASLAREGSPVQRVQWLAASFPDRGDGVRQYVTDRATAEPGDACRDSYEGLLADMDAEAGAHGVALALQVRVTKGIEVGCETLRRELFSLTRQLHDADIVVEGALSADELAARLLRTYEPDSSDKTTWTTTDPWPMAMSESWANVRVDGLWHVTFWVAEWPRTEVPGDFLAPLLLCPARATVSVVMEPLGPDQAIRKVEASRTADLADAELRRRGGFTSTARRVKESEVLARREVELAEGHASFRFAGFVTVSAATEAELVEACDVVQHAAGQCRLSLRRLYGDQASAYTCTLPLARGLT
jgi:hypothetical protein